MVKRSTRSYHIKGKLPQPGLQATSPGKNVHIFHRQPGLSNAAKTEAFNQAVMDYNLEMSILFRKLQTSQVCLLLFTEGVTFGLLLSVPCCHKVSLLVHSVYREGNVDLG